MPLGSARFGLISAVGGSLELIETQTGMDADDLVGTGDEGKIADVKSVNTNGLLARAIKTIQELEARITVLEG